MSDFETQEEEQLASEVEEAAERIRRGMLTARQVHRLKPKPYLVKGYLDKGSLARVYGKPGSLKSFWTLDLAMSIAHGEPWCGRRVRQAPVVWLAGEGAEGMSKRLRAYVKHYGLTRMPPFYMLPWAVPVTSPEWDALCDVLRDGRTPGLVVMDTQARHTAGMDENTVKDMSRFIRGMEQLRDATGACVLPVHHEGVQDGRPRGSTALTGALDHEFRIEREADRIYVHNEKQKDYAASDVPLAFTWERVLLGTDEDGDPVDSLVLRFDVAAPAPGRPVERMQAAAVFLASKAPEPQSLRSILDEMPGDDKANRKAIRRLETEGFVKVERGATHLHTLVREFDG